MTVKFLGTSAEKSIPYDDCNCVQCKSSDNNDKRTRSSILIDKKILIDASPDLLKQLRQSQIENLDTVLITHEHDDHTGGIKYLLRINKNLRIIRMKPGQHFKLMGNDFFGFRVEHSKMAPTVGIIINNLIYIPDSASLSLAVKYLQEAKIAILDGSNFGSSSGGHLSVNEIIAQIKPYKNLKKVYFTHNGHNGKNFKELNSIIKNLGDERFSLAFDGLELKI